MVLNILMGIFTALLISAMILVYYNAYKYVRILLIIEAIISAMIMLTVSI